MAITKTASISSTIAKAIKKIFRLKGTLFPKAFKTAKEKYSDLLKDHPDLIKRVQLGYLASYLGITQVSLSRIRKRFRRESYKD